jgi:hypothetical protein
MITMLVAVAVGQVVKITLLLFWKSN